MVWDSLSVGQSRVDDLCQPATVRMDVISSNEVREAKVIWLGDCEGKGSLGEKSWWIPQFLAWGSVEWWYYWGNNKIGWSRWGKLLTARLQFPHLQNEEKKSYLPHWLWGRLMNWKISEPFRIILGTCQKAINYINAMSNRFYIILLHALFLSQRLKLLPQINWSWQYKFKQRNVKFITGNKCCSHYMASLSPFNGY